MTAILTDIADLAEVLCDPHQHAERYEVWTKARNRQTRRHTTIQDGLIKQLYEAVFHPGGERGRTAPASRPPLALEALGLHTAITVAVAKWCWNLHVPQRDSIEQDIRALVGAISTVDSDTQRTLHADLKRWRTWCEVMTGWETLFAPGEVPCPIVECGQVGTLRILLAAKRAFCRNPAQQPDGTPVCGATWDATTIGVLAEHIKLSTAKPRDPVKVRSGRSGTGGWLPATP